jgi:hypothetical protein
MSIRHGKYRRASNRSAATADKRQQSLNPVMMRTRTGLHSAKKKDESRTVKPTFIEDFLLEHTRFGQQADSTELAGCF